MSAPKPSLGASPVPPRTPATPAKLYTGACHCTRFAYECRHPVLEDGFDVVRCDCSICVQRGYLIAYIPDPQHAFTLTKGTRAELTRYTFNTGVVAHMFCPTCGCGLFAEARGAAKTVVGVNVRTINNLEVELDALQLKQWNGRAR